jgi:tellurium resistance protein TerD
MAIQLQKKQRFNLTKQGASKFLLGLSWDETKVNGHSVDLDASAFMLTAEQKVPADEFFVFYNNLVSPEGAVKHHGDSRTGAADGDDEVIEVDTASVDSRVQHIFFVLTIHESDARGHRLSAVTNVKVRVLKDAEVVCEYEPAASNVDGDSVIVGALHRSGSGWEFEGLYHEFDGGLDTAVGLYINS